MSREVARALTVVSASTDWQFEQIVDLQRRNHYLTVPSDVQAREGFVFTRHTVALLRRMASELPQAIALSDAGVVGYCLSLPLSLQEEQPALAPMFEQFSRCTYRGRSLASIPFMVGGQVCVDRAWRGQGLMGRLYDHTRDAAPPRLELCVTEVAIRNDVSLRAHLRIGFETIDEYADAREHWAIVARPMTAEGR